MTEKEQVIEQIHQKLTEIQTIYKDFCPESRYLTLCIWSDAIIFNNEYWELPEEKRVQFYDFKE